ncbi:uncharacterized protein LOC124125593 isoform X2 [Haliotis rufescens]|uniref:uncharacterized protein LOC124125593 isoform X2 n=1 Tax=Haliotis rufescens TaxID=6454 RepID=UPI00201E9895|nr:uncharacterized protein LOC124125593 isoform X2 [Haliotis rufescens]
MGSQLLLTLFLVCVITGQTRGSLHLTPFPTRTTEGNTYTLMCSSSAGSRAIQWSRNSALTVRTRYVSATQCAEDVISTAVFDTFLSGRINTSCKFNQHNVTLRISAQNDNGSVWWCQDPVKGDRSNNLTIDVVNAEESTAASPVTLMTSPTASSESRTSVSEGSNSLQLTSSQATASSGHPYTLMCSSSGSAGRDIQWHWRSDLIFRTRYVSDTDCQVDVSNNDLYRRLSGRVTVTCSLNQYNVTLRILTSMDNGSVWWCVDGQRSQESNRWTIHVVNLTTVSSTTTISATSATTATTTNFDISTSTSLQGVDAPNVVYIAVGAAVGGIVVGCAITIIVVIMWMIRRKTSTEDDASAPNIYTTPSHYEDMDHQYGKVEMQYVNTVEGIGSGSPDCVNTEDQAGNAAYYNTTGQHQHIDEDADTGNTTYYNTARDDDN